MARERDYAAAAAQLSSFQQGAVIENADIGLETLHSMVSVDTIDTRPVFQRRDRWDAKKQSLLIESFLTNIPVPPVYLAEDNFGSYQVIDGKQRLTAIRDFFDGALRLNHLTKLTELQGARHADLPPEVQSNLRLKTLRVITVMRSSRPELKHDVFLRLNTGGEPLNAQEIRNVAYRGPLNDLIYSLAEHPFLLAQLKVREPFKDSSAYRNMTDAEWVLRFLALRENWRTFSGDFRKALDNFMFANQSPPPQVLEAMEQGFLSAIALAEHIWGSNAFKWQGRDQAISGLWDAQMLALDHLNTKQRNRLKDDPSAARQAIATLFNEPTFDEYVRRATNTPERLQYRVTAVILALGGDAPSAEDRSV